MHRRLLHERRGVHLRSRRRKRLRRRRRARRVQVSSRVCLMPRLFNRRRAVHLRARRRKPPGSLVGGFGVRLRRPAESSTQAVPAMQAPPAESPRVSGPGEFASMFNSPPAAPSAANSTQAVPAMQAPPAESPRVSGPGEFTSMFNAPPARSAAGVRLRARQRKHFRRRHRLRRVQVSSRPCLAPRRRRLRRAQRTCKPGGASDPGVVVAGVGTG